VIVRLVRHGQSTWNAERRLQGQQDPPLSELGRAQARALDLSGSVVLCSDLRRAVQTAALAGATRPHLDARLREQAWGELEGLALEAALARYPDFDYTDVDAAVPGGESLRQVWDRLATLDLSAYGDDVAVVTHGDTIRVARCAFAGRPVEEVGWVLPPNGSVTVLEF
jgi:broad specificity phosphatase PhoE